MQTSPKDQRVESLQESIQNKNISGLKNSFNWQTSRKQRMKQGIFSTLDYQHKYGKFRFKDTPSKLQSLASPSSKRLLNK